ncbi:hypothetical protein CPSG_08680 [Coccidioides posadasii str. Silveira]|uniref:Uncharacterized protein n=1 Tax=Coccidioides posadasii (strain RMSCC 757 / Silveira) TaxID=443226 RepID=E9DFT1_COCPS|nr:hypothetical protein CPSG_08680 [Coccidioides posadasii str. Silveira]
MVPSHTQARAWASAGWDAFRSMELSWAEGQRRHKKASPLRHRPQPCLASRLAELKLRFVYLDSGEKRWKKPRERHAAASASLSDP